MGKTVDIPLNIKRILEDVAKNEHLKDYEISIGQGNKKGEGFLGDMVFVTLRDKESNKTLNFAIKKAFDVESVRNLVPIRESFENEAYFYSTILATYFKLEETYKVTNKIDNFPKCVGTSLEYGKEFIILENLKHLGYEVIDKKKIVDREHIETIFKTYGKFHGISFVFNKKRPEEFKIFSEKLQNTFIMLNKTKMFRGAVINVNKISYEKLIPGKDDEVIKVYKKYLDKPEEIFERSLIQDTEYKVINHGDCWSNNMMFKYQEGQLVDIKLLDFQMVSAGSPVQDLSYVLYSGTNKEVFDDLDNLLDIYYDSLSSYVCQFGENADELYPREILKRDWERYSKFGMIMGMLVLGMKMTKQEDLRDFKDMKENDPKESVGNRRPIIDQNLEESYNERIRDIILNVYKYNAL